jgi:O-antigen/teichoic acid export membrane protein
VVTYNGGKAAWSRLLAAHVNGSWVEEARSRLLPVIAIVASLGVGLIFGLGNSILNTRYLLPADFGTYKLVVQVHSLVATFLNFGLPISVAALLARNHDASGQDRRTLAGATYVLSLALSIVGALALALGALLFKAGLSRETALYLVYSAPLFFATVYGLVLQKVLQGNGSRFAYAAFSCLPSVLYYALARGSIAMAGTLTLFACFGCYFISQIACLAWAMLITSPSFARVKSSLGLLWRENRTNGFPVYLGSLATLGMSNSMSSVIVALSDLSAVGYYGLALAVAGPLAFVPQGLSIACFKEIASAQKLPRFLEVWTWILSVVGFCCFVAGVGVFFSKIFPPAYAPAKACTYAMGVGTTMFGLAGFYSQIMIAYGQGAWLRRASILSSIVLAVAMVGLTPGLRALGASLAYALFGAAYFGLVYFYYRQLGNAFTFRLGLLRWLLGSPGSSPRGFEGR